MTVFFFRLLFWIALVGTLVFAWMPHAPDLLQNDKSQHELAFFTLTVLASLAYPARPLWQIAVAMAVLGALIEVVQGIPFLHRDCDIHDWYADMAAVAVALCPIALLRRFRPRVGV